MEFSTPNFASTDRISGSIGNHYWSDSLSEALDQLMAMANRLHIKSYPTLPMHLYVDENELSQYPSDWRELVSTEAKRVGWEFPYLMSDELAPSEG